MEKLLYKSLVKYYCHLKIVSDTWNNVIVNVKNHINGIKSRCEQYRQLTSPEAQKAEIYQQNGQREKLMLKVFYAIQKEIAILGNYINQLNNVNQELKNKFLRIEETRGNVSLRDNEMKQLINGTPLIPALEKLVIWAKDSQNYYLSLLRNVNENFDSVDYTNESTIINFEQSFNVNNYSKMKIDNILGFTETLRRENIS